MRITEKYIDTWCLKNLRTMRKNQWLYSPTSECINKILFELLSMWYTRTLLSLSYYMFSNSNKVLLMHSDVGLYSRWFFSHCTEVFETSCIYVFLRDSRLVWFIRYSAYALFTALSSSMIRKILSLILAWKGRLWQNLLSKLPVDFSHESINE